VRRPLIESLPLAVKTALAAHTRLAELNTERWAQSYGCTPGDVVQEWQRQINAQEVGDGGK
jgi:hypothetical protein